MYLLQWLRKTTPLFLILGMLCLTASLYAQEPQADTVPDLTGLGVPEAAALLNQHGLLLGVENAVLWTDTTTGVANTVSEQSMPPGQTVEAGTVIDISVLRSPNALLIYDDNDITLVNRTGGLLALAGVTFSSLDGNTQTLFDAGEWAQTVRDQRCMQLWSIVRNGPKGLDDCSFIEGWRIVTDATKHFGTGGNGATQFAVSQNGIQRAVCPVSATGRCEFYLSGSGSSSDVTSYIYLAYSPDRLILWNNTPNLWMPLTGLQLVNNQAAQPGVPFLVADANLFANQAIIGNLDRLAPGQCLYLTNGSPVRDTPPRPCDPIAMLNLTPETAFWLVDFGVDSATDALPHTCPAAIADTLTVCVMPR